MTWIPSKAQVGHVGIESRPAEYAAHNINGDRLMPRKHLHIPLVALAALLGSVFSPARVQAQFSTIQVGYSDNPCNLLSATPSFEKGSDGKTVWYDVGLPKLLITYNWSCLDGTKYTTNFAAPLSSAPFDDYFMKYTSTPLTVKYDPGTLNLSITGPWAHHGSSWIGHLKDTFSPLNGWTYWKTRANSQTTKKNIQTWTTRQEASAALAAQPKYKPSLESVVQPYEKLYAALPINADGLDDRTSALPRPMIRITYTGPTGTLAGGAKPEYFATIYCFPGQGDTDPFNRPAIVSDAFDPFNERSAWTLLTDPRYSELLGQYKNPTGRNCPRAAGYDMFFVDYSQGGGNILINSALFLKAVEWMHTKTQSNIVVGGPSMGGQLPRLAMLYSIPENNEANGAGVKGNDLAPRVKGYLSIDSPHQGASISGTLQEAVYSVSIDNDVDILVGFASLFGDQENSSIDQWRQLCVPAAHQMLYEHFYPDIGQSIPSSHDGFYNYLKALGTGKALGDSRGWRKDMTRVSVAYSNFNKPGLLEADGSMGPSGRLWVSQGSFPYILTLAERHLFAGGAAGTPGWQELTPGSTGNWYWSPYKHDMIKYVFPRETTPNHGYSEFSMHDYNTNEVFTGTFMPIGSTLDLQGFDVMNPPTLNEEAIQRYSSFDAVYYMRETYNSYIKFQGGPETHGINEKRYEHLIFDPQLMSNIMGALQFIEEAPSRKVSALMPYTNGEGVISLTGPAGWGSVPRAVSDGSGTGGFNVANPSISDFPVAAVDGHTRIFQGKFNTDSYPGLFLAQAYNWSNNHVAMPSGFGSFTEASPENLLGITMRSKININDFNGDFHDDILSIGDIGREALTIGLSDGLGGMSFSGTNNVQFMTWARQPEVHVATGDFNGDGKADIVLVGGAGWTQVHMAIGNGDGTFTFKNISAPDINSACWKKGAIFLSGNFRSQDSHDIAVISGSSLYITGFTPSGTSDNFQRSLITPQGWPFWSWAQDPKAKIIVADFNFDGRSDIALTGVPGWTTIPMAFSNGSGSFTFTNKTVAGFPAWASAAGVHVQPMEVNWDYKADLVLTAGPGWTTIPVAMSNGDGTFNVTNVSNPTFAGWSSFPGVKAPSYPADLKYH